MYFDELYLNGSIDPTVQDSVVKPMYKNPTEVAYLRGFRSGYPRRGSYAMVPDYVADPWAWFLAENKDQKISSSKRGSRSFVHDKGHSFLLEKHSASLLRDTLTYTVNGKSYVAKNLFLSPRVSSLPTNGIFPSAGNQPRPNWVDDLAAFGQRAIVRSAPTKHVFSGTQLLGELREGLPRLVGMALIKGRVKDVLKNAGSEYLNYEFGWLPLVSDLKTVATTLLNLDSVLKTHRSQQGKPKRAHFGLPPRMESREWTASIGGLWAGNSLGRLLPPPTPYLPISGELSGMGFGGQASGEDLYYLETLWTKRWFDGSFTSFFDYPDVSEDYLTKAKALVSMDLTPEVLWELAPWSWLVDWIFRIQSSLAANAVAGNGQIVMNYGYVMENSIYRSMFKGKITKYNSYPLVAPKSFFLNTEDVYSRRVRANPFGFTASSPSALSVDQLAILGALGLSR